MTHEGKKPLWMQVFHCHSVHINIHCGTTAEWVQKICNYSQMKFQIIEYVWETVNKKNTIENYNITQYLYVIWY